MDLETPLDAICRIIVRARELEARVSSDETEGDADPTESDDEFAVMEDEANESVEDEIRTALDDLADDQIAEVLALAWVGRGTYDASEWSEALSEANDPDGEDGVTQLLDMPMLAGYLESGLSAFDLSCDGVGQID